MQSAPQLILRFVTVCAVGLVLATGTAQARPVDRERDVKAGRPQLQKPAVESKPVWIVVNLFSGASSKQAVRVRDALAGLGAEGQGIVIPYRDVTVENMKKLQPAFIALSPNGVPWCKYNRESLGQFLQALKVIVEDLQIPVLGVCGGHQALALAFGGKVGPIRGGEDDCLPYGKNPTERGRHYVRVARDDPIFRGMGKTLNMVQNHYDEVKRLPEGFVDLAENELCPYQIIRHPTRPAYGVQAHCEYYYSSRPDGGLLMRNFLEIARTYNRTVRNSTGTETANTPPSQGRVATVTRGK
ncbi:MAG: gamma-glutamyl-gamma-aminobutyrate hydrolase family protein [Desulfomonile sp.]|nr:gamma-glutamyl-gamma-aminobutyrate hydrolase family protein [Desulfomonile sp.]